MTAVCASSILACGMRVTLLDSTGNVANQSNNEYVTKNLIELQFTPEIATGADVLRRSGCNCVIVSAKFPDLLRRFNFQLQLGTLEAGLVSLLTGGEVIVSGPDAIGFDFPNNLECSQAPPPNLALEVWSYVWEVDHQSQTLPFWHWVWPSTTWQWGQESLNTDDMLVTFTGFSTANPVWGHGPYGDDPGTVIGSFGSAWMTADVPPDGVCGLQTVVPSS